VLLLGFVAACGSSSQGGAAAVSGGRTGSGAAPSTGSASGGGTTGVGGTGGGGGPGAANPGGTSGLGGSAGALTPTGGATSGSALASGGFGGTTAGGASTGGTTGSGGTLLGGAASSGQSGTGATVGSGGAGGAPDGGGDGGGALVVTTVKPVEVDGATRVADDAALEGYAVGLADAGDGARAAGLPAASRLAIRYASVSVGTISVTVDEREPVRVNVHSSGALTGSFLHAIIELPIPAGATLTVGLGAGDVPVNVDRIVVGDGDLGLPPDIWNLPPLPVADGPFPADWRGLGQAYTVPEWWREAKFGAWSHWDPQSMPEQGDWYSRKMYQEGDPVYAHHVSTFGHPSEYGYKDICNDWVIDRWDPEALLDLYVEMGARFFMAMGVHHDNFDCWDSAYQPWNSVRVGPKVDIVGTWERIARERGLRFGIGFHDTPARTWGQFMPVRYTSDRAGSLAGVPYDALQTILDGRGKWWEGMDPVDLYGPIHDGADPLRSPFANQFMWRVDDAITKYHPDVVYFDEHAGDSQVDLGIRMGLGFLAPQLVANFYNRALAWNEGRADVVINLKGVGGAYDSFQNDPDLLPFVERALVRSTEAIIESEISAYPFQTETSLQDWHYQAGREYMDARSVIQSLMENVSRNGSMLLNVTQHGRGDLDAEAVEICQDVGAWLRVNGEAVYGSRPFEVQGDGTVAYTRNRGHVYATLFGWNGGSIRLGALRAGGATLGTVSAVELLGSDRAMAFVQDEGGLAVTPQGAVAPLAGVTNQELASQTRVLRITHDRGWFNDDDPGAAGPGWRRRSNLNGGDYNNDLTTSDAPGAAWSATFTGSGVAIIAPKEPGAGQIEVQIDGESRATVDLRTTGARQPQQVAFEVTGLPAGEHVVRIVNQGPGPVAVDAMVVQ